MTPQAEEQLRQWFKKYLNPFMLTLWRLGLGTWFQLYPRISGNVMVVRHIGRKTGKKRFQPLNFAIVDDDIYCVAAFGARSDWYRNIQANPDVEVWLPQGWWAGAAEDVSAAPDRLRLIREVLVGSGFAAYAAGINPGKISDEDLADASAQYRLIRIRRTAARTGPGGPGDLAWVWPVATLFLLKRVLSRRK